MKRKITTVFAASLVAGLLGLSSCFPLEDPGTLQEGIQEFALADFNRLDMGDAFKISVQKGDAFSIIAKGDVRNLNDLDVYLSGNTLVAKYDNWHPRKHDTEFIIVMPELEGVNFSGATNSTINDFDNDQFDIILSGASILHLSGGTNYLKAEVSGASYLNTYDYYAQYVNANVSGASKAKIFADAKLDVVASGASTVFYRGDPIVSKNVSGASTVRKD